MTTVFPNLVCPIDQSSLTLNEEQSALCCSLGHSFDIGKPSYVHLLPVQHKRSKFPGDSKAMIQARKAFFQAGYYAPVSEWVNHHLLDQLHSMNVATPVSILDAGCGEGYYLDQLDHFLDSQQAATHTGENHPFLDERQLYGMDISKDAIQQAARRNRNITWLVASNKSPPLETGCLDMVLSMFGFPDYNSFGKILKPEGKVLLVDAGPDHLLELREQIYPQVKIKPVPSLTPALKSGFSLVEEQQLRFSISLDQQAIWQLMVMTPHFYRAPADRKKQLEQVNNLKLTVETCLRVLEKK